MISIDYIRGLSDRCEAQKQKILSQLNQIHIESTYIDSISDKITQYELYLTQYLSSLSEYLTGVLQRIYIGRNLEVIINIGKGKLDFSITEGGITIPIDSIGGGICAVLDVFLRMFLVKMFNYTPIIFLDESLSFVADDVFDTVLSEVELYAVQNNLSVVYVSHGRGQCDKKYLFEKKGDTTSIRKI